VIGGQLRCYCVILFILETDQGPPPSSRVGLGFSVLSKNLPPSPPHGFSSKRILA
jgi:hypothetical protein